MTTSTSPKAARVVIKSDEQARSYLATQGLDGMIVDGHVETSAACGRCGGGGRGNWLPDGGLCYECHGRKTSHLVNRTPVIFYARKTRREEMARSRRNRDRAERAEASEARQLEGQLNWCEKNGHGRITFDELDAKRDAERTAKLTAEVATLEHVGEVGKRSEFALTLAKVVAWEGAWGTTFLHICTDDAGNKVVYKTSSRIWCSIIDPEIDNPGEHPMPEGTRFTCRASVKEHTMYARSGTNDPEVPQTVVQRLTKVELAASEAIGVAA